MKNFQDKVNFIWSIADLLRGDYKRHEYADVILPFTVFRRLDEAMAPTREAVWEQYRKYRGRLDNLDSVLRPAAGGSPVYNISNYDWRRLLEAHQDIAQNFISYLNGFISPEVQDIIEKFDFRRQIGRLKASHDLLYHIVKRFDEIDLHPDLVSNIEMGYIFEELIRRFSEQYNETAGEHFTPREVIRLMVQLLFSEDEAVLHQPNLICTIYDPACGTGGMLTVAKDYILEHNAQAQVMLFGQELNPTAYAVAKSDMLLKGETPERIVYGNTFSEDGHKGNRFNFMLSNPPFGVEWKKVEGVVRREHEISGDDGRFGAGLPRISDGSLLFLQHMISKMKDDGEGSRIAIIFNGSPLFTGDAGSGESEIRRWIIEHDWLEGIVALPDQLFYNTGISTYIWIVTNRKSERRKNKIQLVDATEFYVNLRRNLGDKRREISQEQCNEISALYHGFTENGKCKIFENREFGYRKVRIERPLRLNFQATSERIARLDEERAFQNLAKSRKKDPELKTKEEAEGRKEQQAIREMLAEIPAELIKHRPTFEKTLKTTAKKYNIQLKAAVYKAILSALSEKDETAEICYDKKGKMEPDPALRDHENVRLTEEDWWQIQRGESYLDERVPLTETVKEFFEREVKPYVPDAFIDEKYLDEKDSRVGRIGYEVNFNYHFYQYRPPRPLVEIETEIEKIEQEILAMLSEVV